MKEHINLDEKPSEIGFTYRDHYISYRAADNNWIVKSLSYSECYASMKLAMAAIDAFFKKQVLNVEAVHRFCEDSEPSLVRITSIASDGDVWFINKNESREKSQKCNFVLITEEARAKLLPLAGALKAVNEQRAKLLGERKAILANDCLPLTLENIQKLKGAKT